ncbi:MAG: ion channel [Vulcanimicrobiota bacterium]
MVTVSTVGYGDMSPETPQGKIFAIFLIIFGLGLFATAILFIAEWYISLGEKKRKGKVAINTKNHLVILNFKEEDTRTLIGGLREDPRWEDTPIVLVADLPNQYNPLEDDEVLFVNGDPTKIRVLESASVGSARTVYIDAHDDALTFAATFAVQKVNPEIDVIAWINNEEQAQLFKELNEERPGEITVISSHKPALVARGIIDRATGLIDELVTNEYGNEITATRAPNDSGEYTFKELSVFLLEKHKAIPVAVEKDKMPRLNPVSDTKVKPCCRIWVISEEPLPDNLAFQN